MSNNNVIPFSPAATGLEDQNQTALFSEEYLLTNNPPVVSLPSDESCEGITLALMLLGKEVTQKAMWFNLEEHCLSRLASYIHNLRKKNWYFIRSERCEICDWRSWHYDNARMAKIKPDYDYELDPKDKIVKSWSKYFIPEHVLAHLNTHYPSIFDWAENTFNMWGGDYAGLDAWDDASA